MSHYEKPMPFWKSVPGFFDYEDVYTEFAHRAKDGDTIVEVGSYLGRSALCLGTMLQELGKDVTVLCVDVWPSTYVHNDNSGIIREAPYETFYANVRQAGLTGIIVPIRQPSLRAARFVTNDLAAVWIDAEHDYENCRADILAWLPKVRSGGVIAGHDWDDTDFPGVSKAVKELFTPQSIQILNRSWVVQR